MDEVHSFHSASRNIPEGEKAGGNIPGRSVSPKDPLLKSQRNFSALNMSKILGQEKDMERLEGVQDKEQSWEGLENS